MKNWPGMPASSLAALEREQRVRPDRLGSHDREPLAPGGIYAK